MCAQDNVGLLLLLLLLLAVLLVVVVVIVNLLVIFFVFYSHKFTEFAFFLGKSNILYCSL